ncbi:MAG: toxin-antitoxin system YwqK family antitoxin [Bacteroidia bacterium]
MRFFLPLLFFTAMNMHAQNVTDAQGRKQGHWKKLDDKTNKPVYEGNFKDGRPDGVFKYYYPHDSVQAILNFKQGGKYAYAKLFHPNGKLMATGKYVGESVKDSIWTYYDDAGVMISRDNYVNGKKNGLCLVFLPDGKVAEEKNYRMDQLHGPFKQYFDGKLVKGEGMYVNGGFDGKVSYYYPSGIVAATGFYKDGIKTGPWIYKNSDGRIKEKELWVDGHLADKKKTAAFFSKTKVGEEKAPEPKKTQGAKTVQKK